MGLFTEDMPQVYEVTWPRGSVIVEIRPVSVLEPFEFEPVKLV
jgi:hypothetical protein